MHTAEKNLEVVRGLIDQANAATGNTDTDLTSAVGSLVEGFGQGGSEDSIDLFSYVAIIPQTTTAFFDNSLCNVTEPITIHLEKALGIPTLLSNVSLNCGKITIYISSLCTSFYRSFRFGTINETFDEIEIIGDTSNVTTFVQTFFRRYMLKRVLGNFDFSNATDTTSMFGECGLLEEFHPVSNTIKCDIKFDYCPLLSDASIQSIIDGLADLTGATSQTLTLNSTVKAKLTEEQIANITNKNWTLA